MRVFGSLVMVVVAGCGHGGTVPMENACTAANADPGACLTTAKERLAKGDDNGARTYMDHLVTAVNASPACLRDHDAAGCFGGVVALLRDKPVGLLASYEVSEDLLSMVPRWTGSDETGPRVQARIALHGMCVVPGRDPIAQQRACIVLGDLIDDERTRRCGLDCDPAAAEKLPGWSSAEVIDGYAAACKVDRKRADPKAQAAFAAELAATYKVTGANAVCDVATSTQHGASIPEALATKDRMRSEARAHQSSASAAAKREAERIAAMETSKVLAAEAAAKAETAQFNKDILEAIHRSDWPKTFGLLTRRRGSVIEEPVATSLDKIFAPFVEWATKNTSVSAAFLDISSRGALAPEYHSIRVSLATLRDLALLDAKHAARGARGVGGVWLHAAIVAKIAGSSFPEEMAAAAAAWKKLVASARTSLALENLAPSCIPIIRPAFDGGRVVKAKSTLQCTIEAEKTFTAKEPFKVKQHVVTADGEKDVEQETMVDVTHRTYKIIIHGVIAIYSGAPRKAVPIDFEEIVDDVDNSDPRKFDTSRANAMDLITRSTVGEIEAADATTAYNAGLQALKVGRKEAAENQLVIHGMLAGSSPELDELMISYGISFAELMMQP
jgi:hypothetical protein